jgi:outer membrane receptor protein involved in Fe transport
VYTAEQNRVPSGWTKSPDWVRLDAGLSWKVRAFDADHRVFLTCTNILDTDYYDYMSMSETGYVFNQPGRNFRGGYSVTF